LGALKGAPDVVGCWHWKMSAGHPRPLVRYRCLSVACA